MTYCGTAVYTINLPDAIMLGRACNSGIFFPIGLQSQRDLLQQK